MVVTLCIDIESSLLQCLEEDSYFSFLPLAHVYDQIMESYCIYKGSSIGFWRGVRLRFISLNEFFLPSIYLTVCLWIANACTCPLPSFTSQTELTLSPVSYIPKQSSTIHPHGLLIWPGLHELDELHARLPGKCFTWAFLVILLIL